MKILYTIGCYWPSIGGAQLYTREMVRHIAKKHQAVVACLRNDTYTDEWLHGWTTKPLKKQKPYFDNRAEVRVLRLGLFRRMLLKRKLADYYSSEEHRLLCNEMIADLFAGELSEINITFDLVHNIKVGEAFFSLASLYFARKNRIPFVFSPISHPEGWTGRLFSHLYSSADALLAMTEVEKAFLVSQGAQADKTFVVGGAPILKGFAPTEDIKKKLSIHGPLVLFLGQKYPYKGFKHLIEAAPLVWAKYPKTHFIFAGHRTEDSKAVFSDKRDARITETGTITDDDKVNLLSACDIFCMPSTLESFGLVYLEAWTFRKPVIAADTETSRCLIQNGHDGILVKQEPRSIATAICALLENPKLRKKIGENGYAKTRSLYSWDKTSLKVEAAYRHALRNSRR